MASSFVGFGFGLLSRWGIVLKVSIGASAHRCRRSELDNLKVIFPVQWPLQLRKDISTIHSMHNICSSKEERKEAADLVSYTRFLSKQPASLPASTLLRCLGWVG